VDVLDRRALAGDRQSPRTEHLAAGQSAIAGVAQRRAASGIDANRSVGRLVEAVAAIARCKAQVAAVAGAHGAVVGDRVNPRKRQLRAGDVGFDGAVVLQADGDVAAAVDRVGRPVHQMPSGIACRGDAGVVASWLVQADATAAVGIGVGGDHQPRILQRVGAADQDGALVVDLAAVHLQDARCRGACDPQGGVRIADAEVVALPGEPLAQQADRVGRVVGQVGCDR